MVASAALGIEPSRTPMKSQRIHADAGFRPRTQMEILKFPQRHTSDKAVSLFGTFLRMFGGFSRGPEATRGDNIPSAAERVTFLSGEPQDPSHPDVHGVNFERVRRGGIDFAEPGNKDIVGSKGVEPQEILNTPADGSPNDVAMQIQDMLTNEHDDLRVMRSSFPNVPVMQAPTMARSIVLQQLGAVGDFLGEMSIPDGSVAARITWTNKAANDLWVSFSSQAFIPSGAKQPATGGGIVQSDLNNDGPILNPDTTKYFLVKSKRAISFRCSAACTVNVQFYAQA
jgi:hypothetical protein